MVPISEEGASAVAFQDSFSPPKSRLRDIGDKVSSPRSGNPIVRIDIFWVTGKKPLNAISAGKGRRVVVMSCKPLGAEHFVDTSSISRGSGNLQFQFFQLSHHFLSFHFQYNK